MKIVKGLGEYPAAKRNGVMSKGKNTSTPRAITFITNSVSPTAVEVAVGLHLDVLDKKTMKWIPGQVKKVDAHSPTNIQVTIMKDGYGEEFDETFKWPDAARAVICGEKIKGRDCPSGQVTNPSEIKINFQDHTSAPVPGFLVDDGSMFDERGGTSYGWSRDMSRFTRKRGVNSDPLLDSLILFPPDQSSQWCTVPEPEYSCEPVTWSIKVANGQYLVKLTAGDPKYSSRFHLQINGKELMVGKKLEAEQFFWPSTFVQVTDGAIRMAAECKEDCHEIWSRVNSIEIRPAKSNELGQEGDGATQQLGCGLAFKGGRCVDGTDSENCIYDDVNAPGVNACSGTMKIVTIPMNYQCADQRGSYKCIRATYASFTECKQFCPGECDAGMCKA